VGKINPDMRGKKCPYCESCIDGWTSPRFFQKDFYYMTLDQSIYSCPGNGCEFKGNQIDLEKHFQNECKKGIIPCKAHCGVLFNASEEKAHIQQCGLYLTCLCGSRNPRQDHAHHMKTTHGQLECLTCRGFFLEENFEDHPCSKKLMSCFECQQSIYLEDYKEHVHLHLLHFSLQIDHHEGIVKKCNEKIQKGLIVLKNIAF